MWYNKIITYAIRLVLVVLILGWMGVIFGFSSKEGDDSQSFSDKITAIVVDIIYDDYHKLPSDEKQIIWSRTSVVVRKTGHFGEYGILALLVSGFMMTYNFIRKNRKYMFLTVIFCAVYAITDEVHQGFVGGRSPKIFDVGIDSLGAIFGTLFLYLFVRCMEFVLKKHTKKFQSEITV